MPAKSSGDSKLPLIIMNHGYGVKNTEYSFLAKPLAALGYFVVSIQHDLPDDKPLPRTGNLYERRMPLWKQGVENISFVLKELQTKYTKVDFDNITLIGHSNGGDISMLFATKEPKLVKNVISIDSLRMHFPRTSTPRIFSLRASDTKADENVLPSKEEQQRYDIEIITLKDAKHNDMYDRGSDSLKKEIINLTIKFLEEE
jgi:dienelactone hydrolase